MDRLLQLGGDKKFLSYDDLNRELPENVVSPDDIEDVLQKLDASNIHVADSDERLIEQAATIAADDEETDEDLELDLSAGALEKTNDPVRLYLREMGVVPLLTREGEVAIAKRIERGQIKTQKAIARSPIAVGELVRMGEELAAGKLNIREVVTFSEQAELAAPVAADAHAEDEPSVAQVVEGDRLACKHVGAPSRNRAERSPSSRPGRRTGRHR